MKNELVAAYNEFMKVPVSGASIEPMYKGLMILASIINSMPDEDNKNDEIVE